MPINASTPRMATKPSGAPDPNNAATTPISPSGATLTTRASLPKLCNWTIKKNPITSSMTGTTAAIGPCDFALSSTAPPVASEKPFGSDFANASIAGLS